MDDVVSKERDGSRNKEYSAVRASQKAIASLDELLGSIKAPMLGETLGIPSEYMEETSIDFDA